MEVNYRELNYSVIFESFIALNKKFIKQLGYKPSALLSILINKERYFFYQDKLDNGFFWHTHNQIEEETFLTRGEQYKAIKVLKEFDFMEVQRKGLPAQNYFKLNHEKINNLLQKPENNTNKKNNKMYPSIHLEEPADAANNIKENNIKKSFSKEKESNSGSLEPSCSSCVNEEENKIKRRRLSSSEKLRSAAKAKRLEPNTYKVPKITSKVQEIFDYWREQELHLPKEGTKEYVEGIKKIKRLFSGKLFDQKFTADDIKLSIDRFSLACFDDEIKPENKAYKKELKKMSLSRFIENSYSKKDKSLFLYYYNNQPESTIEKEENNFPEITQYLIDKYKKQVLSNANIEFNQKQINQFIMAANRIKEFFEKNKRKLHPASRPGDIEKAKYLVDALIDKFGYSISPGHFCSDNTFNSMYPAYLTKQGVLFYEETVSSISELNRSFKPKEEDDGSYSADYFS